MNRKPVGPTHGELREARVTPSPLSARLAKPAPLPEPQIVEPRPQRPPASPRPARPLPQSLPAVTPATVVAPVPQPSAEPVRQAAEPALAVPAAPAVPVATAPPVAAPVGPDAGSVARYRLELMEIARRYKRYPRIAQENNWEGRVELRVAFSENGALSQLSVKKGAGRAVLDEAAQAMIRSAQAQATIPLALRGKAFAIEIPVDFFLKDEER